MEKKKCIKCGEIKTLIKFPWRTDNHIYRNECKICKKIYQSEWYKENKEKIKAQAKQWRIDNPIKYKVSSLTWYNNNKDKNRISSLKWYRANPEKGKKASKLWERQNREKRRIKALAWRNKNRIKVRALSQKHQEKRRQQIKNRISLNFSRGILHAIKKNKNGHHWEDIINYTLKDLIKHLESKFQKNMTWDNYGKYGWHIDHIIPISLWQYINFEDKEFQQCWSLCNLQPLWAKDNWSKGGKYEK